ncbi:Histone acetyltransferase [Glugoides intestinalis]
MKIFNNSKLGNVKRIYYGTHEFKPLFASSIQCFESNLYICSKCISAFPSSYALNYHFSKCTVPFIPIYEEETFKISKIEPLKKKQLLSTIAQMFIKSKTVYFDVEKYELFIIYNEEIIGYFSRYKNGDNSLNCFLVFPSFQGQGWGTVIMDYCTASTSKTPKSPEKPYTRKAIFCFRKYWKYKVIGAKTVNEISRKTGVSIEDAIIGLELNGFNFRTWKLDREITVQKPRILSKKIVIKKHIKEQLDKRK